MMPRLFSAACLAAALSFFAGACERHDWENVQSLYQSHHGGHGGGDAHHGGEGEADHGGEGEADHGSAAPAEKH